MSDTEYTTIKIANQTKKKLDNLADNRHESYDHIIQRLIKELYVEEK